MKTLKNPAVALDKYEVIELKMKSRAPAIPTVHFETNDLDRRAIEMLTIQAPR